MIRSLKVLMVVAFVLAAGTALPAHAISQGPTIEVDAVFTVNHGCTQTDVEVTAVRTQNTSSANLFIERVDTCRCAEGCYTLSFAAGGISPLATYHIDPNFRSAQLTAAFPMMRDENTGAVSTATVNVMWTGTGPIYKDTTHLNDHSHDLCCVTPPLVVINGLYTGRAAQASGTITEDGTTIVDGPAGGCLPLYHQVYCSDPWFMGVHTANSPTT